jgi:hypothetical protein
MAVASPVMTVTQWLSGCAASNHILAAQVAPLSSDTCTLMCCMCNSYQPYDLGFQYSVLPTPYIFKDNLMYVNGNTKQTQGKPLMLFSCCAHEQHWQQQHSATCAYLVRCHLHGSSDIQQGQTALLITLGSQNCVIADVAGTM